MTSKSWNFPALKDAPKRKHQFVPWRTVELWGQKIKIWSFISTFGKMGGCICNLLACLVSQSCPTLCDALDYSLPGSSVHGIFSGKNTGVGCHFLLRVIVPAQGLNLHLLCLLHCRQIFYLVAMTLDLPVTLNFPEISPTSWFPLPSRQGFPGSSVGKESTCNAGDPGSIPGLGRSTGEGIGCPLQYSWASPVAQLVKNLPAMWVDLGSIPELGRSLGEGNSYPLQYSSLENSMDYSPRGYKELDMTEQLSLFTRQSDPVWQAGQELLLSLGQEEWG